VSSENQENDCVGTGGSGNNRDGDSGARQPGESDNDPRLAERVDGVAPVVNTATEAEPVTSLRDYSPSSSTGYSPKPSDYSREPAESDYSPDKTGDYSPVAKAEVVDIADYRRMVTSLYDESKWKRSRVKTGMLIARIQGYDIVETEYGVSYLWVVTRSPKKRTSADSDQFEHAGFYTWQSLQMCERLVKEIENGKRVSKNRNRKA